MISTRLPFLTPALFALGFALSAGHAHAQAGQLVYVPNSTSNDVSVYRTNADGSLTAVTTIAGITTAEQAAVRGDQAFAYVSAFGSNQVKVIDTGTNTVVQTVATGTKPFGVAVSPDGTRVYVANVGAGVNTVSVFSADALTGQLSAPTTIAVGNNPRAIRFSSDGSRAYVANQDTLGGNGSVSVINTATNSVIATINTGGQLVDLAVNPAGTRVYVVDINNKVNVIDTATNTVVATPTATLNNPRGILVSADGSRFYVTNINTTSISQFDAATNASLGTVAAGNTPGWMTLSPDGKWLYVAQGGTSDTVGIYSVSSGLLVGAGTIAAGTDPFSVGICGNGSAMLASGKTFIANTAGALGCVGSSADFTGGTLRINGAGLAITTPMTLGSAGGTIDTNGNDATVSSIISGSGGLTKTGTGLLILNGANSYTGATTVSAGTLEVGDINTPGASISSNVTVNAAGTLRGHGTITGNVVNSGTIMPGGSIGTLTVNGNVLFNPGSVFSVELNPSQTSSLRVTGGHTATLGGSVQVLAENGNYAFLTHYTILSADGGMSGRFSGVTSNLAFLTPSLSYDANNVYLNLVRNDMGLGAVAVTANQQEVGNALAAISGSGGGNADMRSLLNTIVGFSAPQARSAYDSLSGVQNSYAGTLAMQQSRQFQEMLFDRLHDSSASQPLALGFTQGSLLAYSGTDWSQFLIHHLGSAKRKGANASERGMWLRGFGGSGDVKATADASGTDYQSGGLALGIDGDLGDTATVGAAFGYTRTNGNTAAGHLDMDSFQAAAYGNWQDEGYYLSGMAGIGRHKTNARRQVVAGSLNAQATAAYQSWTGTAAAETGRNFDLSHLSVTPFVGLAYTHLGSDAFTESGAGAGNLQVGVGRQNSLESSLGVRLSSDWKTVAGREIRPVVEAAHVHQHRDNVSRLDTRFDASPDNVFVIRGPELDRNRTRIGAGLTAQLSKTAYLNAGYNGDFAGSDRHHSIAVTFKMQW